MGGYHTVKKIEPNVVWILSILYSMISVKGDARSATLAFLDVVVGNVVVNM